MCYIVTTDSNSLTDATAKDFGIVAYKDNTERTSAYCFLKKLLGLNKKIIFFSKTQANYLILKSVAAEIMKEDKSSEIFIVDAASDADSKAKKAAVLRCSYLTACECLARL